MKIWKLKKGHDSRLRARHPWVFSNELSDSPKTVGSGEAVEVQDFKGQFLAQGYGNPHSLISFRALSFSQQDEKPLSPEALTQKLFKAWKLRHNMGFKLSFRVCFSEADEMPGLIFDRYVFTFCEKKYQVFSYQLLTSGMDTAFKSENQALAIFEKLTGLAQAASLSVIPWSQTILLQRNDVSIRKLEGLMAEEPLILKNDDSVEIENISIEVQNVLNGDEKVFFNVNLIEGQKTGFFLDQTFNMKLLLDYLYQKRHTFSNRNIKILDLCCYMGQWSVQLVHNLKKWGIQCEVHLVDSSDLALKKAAENLAAYDVPTKTHKMDVLEGLGAFQNDDFDVVISDPPAFVKNKKDLPTGLHAYFKLNAQAFRVCQDDGVIVSCTCSGLVQLSDFKDALKKALLRSGKSAKCILSGGQGWDHPTLITFPEGFYLKMVMHQMN